MGWRIGSSSGRVSKSRIHLVEIYDAKGSEETISRITAQIVDVIVERRNRLLEPAVPANMNCARKIFGGCADRVALRAESQISDHLAENATMRKSEEMISRIADRIVAVGLTTRL